MNVEVIHGLRSLSADPAVGTELVELPQRHQEFGICIRAGQFVNDTFKRDISLNYAVLLVSSPN